MKMKSSAKETWKLYSLATLLGCFLLLLFIDHIHQNTSFLTARNFWPSLTPAKLLGSSNGVIVGPLEPSSFTLLDDGDDLLKPSNTSVYDHAKDEQRLAIDDVEKGVNKTNNKCNIFDGRWIYMPEETPSYNSTTCPFLEEKMSCQKNGRPDFEYQKWRWEGRDCDVPLFNGIDMMERLRNKRMIIAGDSLNRNMWESLACLLYTSISPSRAEVKAENPVYKTLKAKDYNFTIEFYWSPFLIEYDRNHKSGKRVIVLDKLSPNSEGWRGADIMVFNSGHWWTKGRLKYWDLFQYGEELKEEMPIETAYKRGMRTWAKWIKKNVDPKKTTVFFRSISAQHTLRQYDQWCYNVTQPLMDRSYVSFYPKSFVNIIESLVKKMSKLQVKYLNITKLSEYRIDAHPSIFRSQEWKNHTKEFEDNISNFADCSHWCLPGVPDTWNTLLYAYMFFDIWQ